MKQWFKSRFDDPLIRDLGKSALIMVPALFIAAWWGVYTKWPLTLPLVSYLKYWGAVE